MVCGLLSIPLQRGISMKKAIRALSGYRRERGFTLIELLVVVAIIGIIAAILIPNLIDAMQKAKQKRTMSDMRTTGTSWMAWLTDQVGAAGAGQQTFDWTQLTALPLADLQSDLVPQYAAEVPLRDGWRNTYEYARNSDLEAIVPIAIRSWGSDSAPDGDTYTIGPFMATDYAQDIIWAGGYFVRWPSGLTTQ